MVGLEEAKTIENLPKVSRKGGRTSATFKLPKRKPAKVDLEELNIKRQMFVKHLVADKQFNATNAALAAGYGGPEGKLAAQAARKLLIEPEVQAAIATEVYERLWRCNLEPDRVLRELMAIAFFDPADLYDEKGAAKNPKDLSPEVRRAIRSARVSYSESATDEGEFTQTKHVEVTPYDKLTALELVMRHAGMLDARIKVEIGVTDAGESLLKAIERVEAERQKVMDSNTLNGTASVPRIGSKTGG